VSWSERKPAPWAVIVASVFKRSRVERARRAKARDGEHVALSELREHTGELGAVGLRAAGLLAVEFGATFGADMLELSVERLPSFAQGA
jgi:hypothetical protein